MDDEFVQVRETPEPSKVLGDAELIIFEVLRKHGPLLHRLDFERRCVQRGMNPSTFGLYPSRSPILTRYAPGVYGLKGASFSARDLERLAVRREEKFSDHGWTEMAQPWVAIGLSSSVLATGIVHIPAGIREFIVERYALRTEDHEEIGSLVVSERAAWGLSPFFRRRGGEVGDVLVCIFDLRQRYVIARVGNKESVLPETTLLNEEISGETP